MVAILMSTYNGANYLREQIDSILLQSFSNFQLFIRDDGSTDDTVSIIKSYHDPRIQLEEGNNIGPAKSFFKLLQQSLDFDYIFFSDQDDIWYKDKLSIMLNAIKPYDEIPTMVFSDFKMIDGKGVVTAPSYSKYASLQVAPGNISICKVIAQPYVFGCASVINQKLAKLAAYPPEGIEMHDCWLCQSAAATGNLIYIPEQTIAHRFHSSNATGRSNQDSISNRIRRLTRDFQSQTENSKLRLRQINLLLNVLNDNILPEARETLAALKQSLERGRFAAVHALRKNGVSRQNKLNTLFFYITVLGIRGEII